MTETSPPPHKHVPALDGFRGLAIALVMFHHFFHGIAIGPSMADKVFFGLAHRGWVGVDLFFVLSGFLITGILHDARERAGYFRNFYMRRLLRIFPAYYFLLFVFFVVLVNVPLSGLTDYFADSKADAIWNWTYLTNFRIAWRGAWYHHDVPNVFWSLAIEEQFYLAWPLVVFLLSRRALLRVCAALFVVALAVRVWMAVSPRFNGVGIFVFTPARMDGLVIGAFLALALRGPTGLLPVRRWLGIAAVAAAVPLLYLETQHGRGWEEEPAQTFRFTGYALLFAWLLVLTLTAPEGSLLKRAFCSRPMRFLGNYSYAIYLWHGPADLFSGWLFGTDRAMLLLGSHVPGALLHSTVASAMSIAAALLSWHLIEKHFLRLKNRFGS